MIELLGDLGFAVIDGDVAPDEVARALSTGASFEAVLPRRLALAETLHVGDEQALNRARFAVFSHAGKTLVAKPGQVAGYGEPTFEVALSRRFGECFAFHSHLALPGVWRYRGGALDAGVDELGVSPPGGLLGFTRRLSADDGPAMMRVALVAHVGAPWSEIFPRLGATASFWRLP